jgi:hypothetical protein
MNKLKDVISQRSSTNPCFALRLSQPRRVAQEAATRARPESEPGV